MSMGPKELNDQVRSAYTRELRRVIGDTAPAPENGMDGLRVKRVCSWDDYTESPPQTKESKMYNFCFKSCLVTLAIATAFGVAAIWVPDSWHEVGAQLLWTDAVLFVGSTVGALLCKLGDTK